MSFIFCYAPNNERPFAKPKKNLAERSLEHPEKQLIVKNVSESALECHEKQKITKNSAHGSFMTHKKQIIHIK